MEAKRGETRGAAPNAPRQRHRVVVLDIAEELDAATAPRLATHLSDVIRDLARDPARPDVVIDLSGVTFMSSDGVAVLLRAQRSAESAGLRLWVERPGRAASRVLEVLRLEDVLSPPDGAAS